MITKPIIVNESIPSTIIRIPGVWVLEKKGPFRFIQECRPLLPTAKKGPKVPLMVFRRFSFRFGTCRVIGLIRSEGADKPKVTRAARMCSSRSVIESLI